MSFQRLSTDLLFSRFLATWSITIVTRSPVLWASLAMASAMRCRAMFRDWISSCRIVPSLLNGVMVSNLKQSGVETENRMIAVNLKPVGGVEFDETSGFYRGHPSVWASG